MGGSCYLSSPSACSRAGTGNHRKHLLLPSKKLQKPTEHNEILKACNFPEISARLWTGETALPSDGRMHKHKEHGRNSRRKQTRGQLTVLLPAWWLHSEEHDTIFGALWSALERCTVEGQTEKERRVWLLCPHTFKNTVKNKRLTFQFQYQWFLLKRREEKRTY